MLPFKDFGFLSMVTWFVTPIQGKSQKLKFLQTDHKNSISFHRSAFNERQINSLTYPSKKIVHKTVFISGGPCPRPWREKCRMSKPRRVLKKTSLAGFPHPPTALEHTFCPITFPHGCQCFNHAYATCR